MNLVYDTFEKETEKLREKKLGKRKGNGNNQCIWCIYFFLLHKQMKQNKTLEILE